MIYEITPVPKPRMTQRDKWAQRPCVMKYRAFKDKCRLHRVAIPQPCKVIFWLPMPVSWSGARRSLLSGQPHTSRPDLDNLLKALCDAALKEDSTIWSVQAEKRWTQGPARIEILPVPPP